MFVCLFEGKWAAKQDLLRDSKVIVQSSQRGRGPEKAGLDKVVLANGITLNYLLAEQGGICAVYTTTCSTWINTPGELENHLHKITKKAT